MARHMTGLRAWLRPPRNILVFFILIVCLPALALVGLGIRFLEQDRELAGQRQIEMLDRAADQAVRVLEQDVAARRKQLDGVPCTPADPSEDSVCIVFHPDRIEAVPPHRIPYYPRSQRLTEAPSEPFETLEFYEFRQGDVQRALDISRELSASSDPSVRAGALLRQGRILRKMGKTSEALTAYTNLSRIPSVSINGEPAELVGRRTRCAILEEQSQLEELRKEAELLATDLRAGKWQLDRETSLHVKGRLDQWLGRQDSAGFGSGEESLASALSWTYERWSAKPSVGTNSGIDALNTDNGIVTILWSFGGERDTAFLAGPRYLESHWMTKLDRTVHPARVFVAGTALAGAADAVRVQRSAADTRLPWTLVVTTGQGRREPPEFAARRRNLAAGLGLLLILIAAGSYFVWRAMNRELAVVRLQSDFVSAVSHEFRTPLTSLRQFNELLTEEDGPTPEKRRSFYQAQTRATDRLQRLVESLLDFGRMEEGHHPYKFKPVDAAVLAHDVTEEFFCEVNGRGFDVKCSSDAGPHPVSADADALSRALWNLLDNAVKYSGESRNVELNVSRSNGMVAIAVRDYGIGIPVSEQETIFQKFVRGAASASGGIRGTGLGLAMVRHIVEAHSGTMNLQSVEGMGSTFTIVLPARGE